MKKIIHLHIINNLGIMRKRIISFVVMAICNTSLFAQSVYMHEAQEDASHSIGDGISDVLGILTLIAIGIVVIIVVPVMVKGKISDVKSSKKINRYFDILENEAITILNTLAINNNDFAKIKDNPIWKEWYLKGYRNGVDKGEMEMVKNDDGKYERIPWEEYSERRFSLLESSELYIRFELGGDARLSKLAYDEGRRNGVRRRQLKGDSMEMLD